jgi:hypothetical protein
MSPFVRIRSKHAFIFSTDCEENTLASPFGALRRRAKNKRSAKACVMGIAINDFIGKPSFRVNVNRPIR